MGVIVTFGCPHQIVHPASIIRSEAKPPLELNP